jgi:hypothetical protein
MVGGLFGIDAACFSRFWFTKPSVNPSTEPVSWEDRDDRERRRVDGRVRVGATDARVALFFRLDDRPREF